MPERKDKFASTSYGRIAFLYDFLDRLAGNVCDKTRTLHLQDLPANLGNVLEIGCGTGKFAALFVVSKQPGNLTLNDLSPKMLDLAQTKVSDTGWQGGLATVAGDITRQKFEKKFDLIILHFVLAIFPEADRVEFLRKVADLLNEDGVLWLSDFTRPRGFRRLVVFYVNWWVTVLLFWILAGNKPNALGDVEGGLKRSGLFLSGKKTLPGGLYGSFLLKKTAGIPSRALEGLAAKG